MNASSCRHLSVAVCGLLLAGCGAPAADVTGADHNDDTGALDIETVLDFLNGPECTVATLTDDIGVRANAANNIVAHVRGADGRLGTSDDDRFGSIAELDLVPQVGPATIDAIKAYVAARYVADDLVIEGVSLSVELAAQIVDLCNVLSLAALDNDVGLDARAAGAIVSARPFTTIEGVAAASYVGGAAIARLRDFALAHPPTPVVQNPARVISVIATDSTHIVATFNRPLAANTPDSAFDVFIGEPDAGVSASLVSIVGVEVTLETDEQEAGLDYTFEIADTARDADGNLVDPHGRWAHFDGFVAVPPPPPPATIDCAQMTGGTFDGVAYSATEECRAVEFLDYARFSEMGAFVDKGRRTAYDCAPNGTCGFRTSAWTHLAQFADFAGIGQTSLASLKVASANWTRTGLPYDTVANVWQSRAALVDQPVHLDNVYVVRRLPDQISGNFTYGCVELRDQPNSANYFASCVLWVGSDSSPACALNVNCLDLYVGTRVSLRGMWRTSSQASGGYRMVMQGHGPQPANPDAL